LHTHVPMMQRSPSGQADPVPQAQLPAELQPSARSAEQLTHFAPLTPQLPRDAVSQVPLLQQPWAQDVPLQTHRPSEQANPWAHSSPVPQLQFPAWLQPSERSGSQTPQTAPLTPQVAFPGVLQLVPEQHPGQLMTQPLQAPPVHVWPFGQVSHACPALPHTHSPVPLWHAVWVPIGTQMLFWQHPVGQELPSQLQAPPRQCCPATHIRCEPQLHVPAAEQLSVSSGSQTWHVPPPTPQVPIEEGLQMPSLQQPSGQLPGSQTQIPAGQCWCSPQAGCVPHWQFPSAEQLSARSGSQLTQVPPLTPQVEGLR